MTLSLKKRIQLSFILSIALVATIGAISFYYISQLNDQVQQIVDRDIALSHSGEKIKTSLFSLRRSERIYLLNPQTPNFHETMQKAIDQFEVAVKEGLELSLYEETKKTHQDILGWLKEYEHVVQKTQIPFSPLALSVLLDEKIRNIRNAVTDISSTYYENLEAHRKEAQRLTDTSSRNLILMIVTTILAGLAVGFFAPSKVVIPFKKLVAAIREVQAANFNVSVHIEGNDEIAELGNEFNKMVEEIRVFDDMKIKKIAFEKRKLDVLANMIHAGIVILSVEGEILYMNRTLYELLGLTTERVLQVPIDESPLPQDLKTFFHDSIDRKDRFEGRQWTFTSKGKDDSIVQHAVQASLSLVRNHVGDIVNFVITLRTPPEPVSEQIVANLGDTE